MKPRARKGKNSSGRGGRERLGIEEEPQPICQVSVTSTLSRCSQQLNIKIDTFRMFEMSIVIILYVE